MMMRNSSGGSSRKASEMVPLEESMLALATGLKNARADKRSGGFGRTAKYASVERRVHRARGSLLPKSLNPSIGRSIGSRQSYQNTNERFKIDIIAFCMTRGDIYGELDRQLPSC